MKLICLLCLAVSGCASYPTHYAQSPLVFEGEFNAQPQIAIVERQGQFLIEEVHAAHQ